ncbi:hypothetical protein S7335_75 [Synechococcus sp. PCC 7335]|uniref:nuclear transport factor 2 family protein n=1 Tax=Synechococcus sp. (strain ATCC 29403 / PCC 7335) TaxID=91464 RepID=UPI00017EE823|nr:nuclear transport factor 2 family protein [Synechococcus sp. PCC 7335]EDX82897.1 hypothetical protein S7335_75 [Synechococcus sp. PCC 7335]
MINAIAHPNISLVQQLNFDNLAASPDLFSDKFVWHSFNPKLRDVQGNYVGIKGLRIFFRRLQRYTGSTFRIEPVSLVPIGDELVIAHVVDHMLLYGAHIELDAVIVWRIVNGLIVEVWDIPSLYVDRTEPLKPDSLERALDMAA